MHGADKNLSVHVYIYFFAKLSALCTKRTIIIDIQHVAQCRHHRKSYALLCTRFCTQWCIQFQHLSTRRYALSIKGLTSKSAECRQNGKLKIVGVSVCTNLSALVYTCLHLSTLVFYTTWSFARQQPRHNVRRRQRHLLCHPHNRRPRHRGRDR